MDVEEYKELALSNFDSNPGAFYGTAAGLSLGAGLIYRGVIFPLFNREARLFDTVQGFAYVLTHECDVDQNNDRHFNDLVVVCPLIPLLDFVEEYENRIGEADLRNLLVSVARNDVYRVFFLPPPPSLLGIFDLPHGALMYLNHLCSAHVSVFADGPAEALCALSNHGLDRLDWKLQNLFFRPKAEVLPRLT
jgi:hypothetical protein